MIITGGMQTDENGVQKNDALKTVSVYSEAGWQRDLTSLNQARTVHACGSYKNGGKKVNNPHDIVSYLIDLIHFIASLFW